MLPQDVGIYGWILVFFNYFAMLVLQEWFAVYVELNQQIAALLNAGDEEDLVELKALQQQLSDVCYRQASQLEFRQNLLQAALEFHGVAQDVSVLLSKHLCSHLLQAVASLLQLQRDNNSGTFFQ